MTLKEAQQEVDSWIKKYGVRYFSELTNMAVLTEEVGELARVMARKYGDQSFKEGNRGRPLGTSLHCQPDRCRHHRSICTQHREENQTRPGKTYQ